MSARAQASCNICHLSLPRRPKCDDDDDEDVAVTTFQPRPLKQLTLRTCAKLLIFNNELEKNDNVEMKVNLLPLPKYMKLKLKDEIRMMREEDEKKNLQERRERAAKIAIDKTNSVLTWLFEGKVAFNIRIEDDGITDSNGCMPMVIATAQCNCCP